MTWVLLAVVVVLLVVIGALLVRQRRSRQLKEGFGPEYRRAVAEHGNQRAAEKDLTERRRRVDKFEIRPLNSASRERYTERWGAAQRQFVDEPAPAVAEAHALVQEVMRERGYPVEDDFDQRAADISVDHPGVVENYRAAHDISMQAGNGQVGTEHLRQAMVHFRALFDDLLAPDGDETADEPQPAGEPRRTGQPERVEQTVASDQTIRRDE